MGCRYWYQVTAIPQVNGTRFPENQETRSTTGRNEEIGPVFSQTRNINRLTEPFVFSMAIREPDSVNRGLKD
jgi:hypothetical protein